MPRLFAIGCSARICRAKCTLKRQKSISSQAASISAWKAVFDWPSMVAALSRCAPRAGEQVGGLEQDRGAVVEGQRAPAGRGVAARPAIAALGVGLRGVLQDAEHVLRGRAAARPSISAPPPIFFVAADGGGQVELRGPPAASSSSSSAARSGLPGA